MKPSIALIILNWNLPKITIETVDSILKIKSTKFTYQIFLVDNGSTDNSLKEFSLKYGKNKHVSIVKTGRNLGYAGGNNFGIKQALKKKFNYLLIANNDILVKADFLEKLYLVSQKNPRAVLSPKIYFAPGFEYHRDRYSKNERGKVIWALGGRIDWNNVYGSNIAIDEVDHGQYDRHSPPMDFISGCCFFAPAHLFKKIGLFDEKFFLYLEDADFTQRAKKNAFKLLLVPESVIWHLNSGSSKPGSSLQDYFITRNRLLFGFRYAPLRTKLALFRESIVFLFTASHWRRQAVKDFYLGRFGKGSWK